MSTCGLAEFWGASSPVVYDLLLDRTDALLPREDMTDYIGHGGELTAEPTGADGDSAKAPKTQSFGALS